MSFAQKNETESARTALKSGSSKELLLMLDKSSELTILGKRYNKDNCESALKDFFIEHPAQDFKFVHNGSSKDGTLSYSIGHYQTKTSKHRIVIRFKKVSDSYKIHKLEVSEF